MDDGEEGGKGPMTRFSESFKLTDWSTAGKREQGCEW